ncbi:tRNA lysidine(34) synthetase TilS [Roseateles aquatilis]|uniref:tRNA(Ile)-lysidine synthase n=1 Tax=Roseateles aquatilis TaxID=431061 RepID=A0A246JH41_9BURK|nr:tRNA lysidine(34) synthetase TilS [Roseateles aquatilis]OWQ91567.1 tRNA lysidine(34) synthetase TilS [Roseateles aquatilis]
MADSATPRAAESGSRSSRRVLAVACSGGRDSTALLHATACSARSLGLHVVALHIHHGLNPRADAWLDHVSGQVSAWVDAGLPIELRHERLSGAPAAGDSIEAWARAGRHAALQRLTLAAGADLLLLAHHRRDQAETFLLQALRGAGSAGLSAMPRAQWRDGVCWVRPWLDRPREAVEAYVAEHRLTFIDDDSNTDPRYARNQLRLRVWPALCAQSPGAEAALARAAEWAQQATELQREIATEDLRRWSDATGLSQAMLRSLSAARATNALRAWLHRETERAAPASLIRRLLVEAPEAVIAQWPLGDVTLHLYRGRFAVRPRAPEHAEPVAAQRVDLARPGRHAMPDWRGTLDVEPVTSDGIGLSRLSNVELRPREGGERFQAHGKGVPRSLKKCWQTAGIPAAQREGPLIHVDGRLLFVPGLGLDARLLHADDEAQMALRWTPDAC